MGHLQAEERTVSLVAWKEPVMQHLHCETTHSGKPPSLQCFVTAAPGKTKRLRRVEPLVQGLLGVGPPATTQVSPRRLLAFEVLLVKPS